MHNVTYDWEWASVTAARNTASTCEKYFHRHYEAISSRKIRVQRHKAILKLAFGVLTLYMYTAFLLYKLNIGLRFM